MERAWVILLLLLSCHCEISCSGNDHITNHHQDSRRYDLDADWSPDGQSIIFVRLGDYEDSKWTNGLFRLQLSDSSMELIFLDELPLGDLYSPSWSPDMTQIVFNQRKQIFIYNLANRTQVQLSFKGENFRCGWSPAGNLIAYHRTEATGGLILVTPSGAGERVAYGFAGKTSWFPDGFRLATLGLGSEVYLIDTLGVTYEKITETGLPKLRPAVSPDGNWIVFPQQAKLDERYDIWIIASDGTGLRRLWTGGSESPSWSPDGNWIVFTNSNDHNGFLWVIHPDGTGAKQITFPPK